MKAFLVILLLALNIPLADAAQPLGTASGAGIDPRPGAALPRDVVLIDSDGERVVLGALLADQRPVLLAPVYFECPNICGPTLAGLFAGLSEVPFAAGQDYAVLAVSIDPREGPAEAAAARREALARLPGAEAAGVRFLTGEEAQTRELTAALGFAYAWDEEQRQYAHSSAVAVLTPEGKLSRWLGGVAFEPDTLRLALVEAGKGTIGSFTDQVLLLCYRYDPATGRYNRLTRQLLWAGGGLTVVALAAFVGWSLRGEMRGRR